MFVHSLQYGNGGNGKPMISFLTRDDLVSLPQKKRWSHEPGGDLGTIQTSKNIGCEIASLWNLSFNCIARNSSRLNRTYWKHHDMYFCILFNKVCQYTILRNSTVIHSGSSYWLMLFGCILPNHSLKIMENPYCMPNLLRQARLRLRERRESWVDRG